MEGSVSYFFSFSPQFLFYVKKQVTFCHFFKLHFQNFIKQKLGPKSKISDMVPSI